MKSIVLEKTIIKRRSLKTDMPSTNITTAQKPLLETSPQYPSSRDPTEERKNPSSLSYPSPLFPVPISTWIKTTEFLNNGTRENGVVLAKVLYHPLYNSCVDSSQIHFRKVQQALLL